MNFCNINFNILDKKELYNFKKNQTKILITANAQIITLINKLDWFFKFSNENYVSFDGTIPFWFAKILNPKYNIEKISGSNLMFDLEDILISKKYRIFLLGGTHQGNEKCVLKYKSKGIDAKGISPPKEKYPISYKSSKIFLKEILEFKPDILLVGFGAPKQERWISDNINELKKISPKLIVGVGGSFEMYGGLIKKSPKLISALGLESFWRLIQEPNLDRLFRIINSFYFLKYLIEPKNNRI